MFFTIALLHVFVNSMLDRTHNCESPYLNCFCFVHGYNITQQFFGSGCIIRKRICVCTSVNVCVPAVTALERFAGPPLNCNPLIWTVADSYFHVKVPPRLQKLKSFFFENRFFEKGFLLSVSRLNINKIYLFHHIKLIIKLLI